MFVFKVAVVGAGVMGGQIAQTIAAAGFPVVLKDVSEELVTAGIEEARQVSEGAAAKLVSKGKRSEQEAQDEVKALLALIEPTVSYDGFGDVDFVIEAVPERIEVKQAVFAELDAATPGHAILATNTSSLSISEISDATLRPQSVVGFHYFYPASLMPLIEVIAGQDTSLQTISTAVSFAQAIRKQAIVCEDAPGFVVNRILTSGMSEVWRAQEEGGLSIKQIDEGMSGSNVVPVGPYHLVSLLGLDTVLHVAEHLADSYGPERFYVPTSMQALVAEGKLGVKTGGEGYYGADGGANVDGEASPDVDELVEMLSLKTLIEACLVLEEGVATHRDIDFGMMAGAGLDPRRGLMPPLMKADSEGLDTVLERLERAAEKHGDRFAPPTILRRLLACGRLGASSGEGFYPYPRVSSEQPAEKVKLERRDGGIAIAWLANGPMNAISPAVVSDLRKVWDEVSGDGGQTDGAASPVRALVIASSNPFLFCAGADVKAFTQMDADEGKELLDGMHSLLREMEGSSIVTIAAVNGLAYGGGCELAMACDFRIAARSASFGQPEVKLGIIPGFGGTQRLRRLMSEAEALAMNLTGEPMLAEVAVESGLVNEVVDDHELLEYALLWARKLASQAQGSLRQIKRLSSESDLDDGIEAEKVAFLETFASADAKEGISAFLAKRPPKFSGD